MVWALAISGDMSGLAALVARLILGSLGAFAAHVTLNTTVVALGRSTGWAITGLVVWVIAVVAASGATWSSV